MTTKKQDIVKTLDQPFPAFLELIDANPGAAIAEFERAARAWLCANPTPSMRKLTAAEQQDVIEETINRCKIKDGEPLRNYTDMWGSFGKWLATVAESTCDTTFRKRAPRPEPPVAEPVPRPVAKSSDVPPREKPAPSEKKQRPAARPSSGGVPQPGRIVSALDSLPARLRSPQVLAPIAVAAVILAVFAIRSSRSPYGRAPVTTGPIDISLLVDSEALNARYDVLELDHIPAAAAGEGRIPMTAVFRSGRLTVLRLLTGDLPENSVPARLIVENEAGEVAWDSTLEPEV
ncbi:MAG: hypothetical protein ACYSTL_08350, partial [Planctomycetota bacterium]